MKKVRSAVSLVRGPLSNGPFSGNNLARSGRSGPCPGLLTVVRRTLLQEIPGQAVARYLSQRVFNFILYWTVIRGRNVSGGLNGTGPNRFPNSRSVFNFTQP